MTTTGQDTPTMTVTVRDRAAEAPWGYGLTSPKTRTVTISAHCPRCGSQRGEPTGRRECDDGAYYWVQTWTNPCGHVDMYAAVIVEAVERTQQLGRGEWVRRDPTNGQPWEGFTHEQMTCLLEAVREGQRPDVASVESRTAATVVLRLSETNGGGTATFRWEPSE